MLLFLLEVSAQALGLLKESQLRLASKDSGICFPNTYCRWQYRNIFSLIKELGISWPFTNWTRSSFYNASGIQVEAPVFNELPRLPTPLGSLVYTSPYFRSLSVLDRLSALPLVKALIEYDVDEKAYMSYDFMTARQLFREGGISARLYTDFLEPFLLVTLFASPEKLSAAAALGTLYYYALAHQQDFDVCWCKGPVAELIFIPWIHEIERLGGSILQGIYVQDVVPCDNSDRITSVIAVNKRGDAELYNADVVVFAVGVKAMQKIVASSMTLEAHDEFVSASNIGSIDVMAIRLWFDAMIPLQNPSNVLAGIGPGVGATLFDLNALQEEFSTDMGSVMEVDLYHANPFIPLSDNMVIEKIMKYLIQCDSRFGNAQIIDSSVLRYKEAVTLFGPGSHQYMASTETSFSNVFIAGDWLKQGPGSHGARGLSQEKAYVSGLIAANAAARYLGIDFHVDIINTEEDEPHVAAAKYMVREMRKTAQNLGIDYPFL
ncbi:uncharacterized protein LOC131039808 isoform X2 [Cryptomeria japonica]|uniref:uncharacterized protein LOC131039808 isoform X2 n=1 Tax=Cryptomeria japonica TaxID=3369 RepID=UPI0025ABC980|nr:uncharacterized protein LOC131039808 isoform X2 [Cryptomeria japonica]